MLMTAKPQVKNLLNNYETRGMEVLDFSEFMASTIFKYTKDVNKILITRQNVCFLKLENTP